MAQSCFVKGYSSTWEGGERKNAKLKYKLNSQIICPASLRDTAPARKERRKFKIKMKRWLKSDRGSAIQLDLSKKSKEKNEKIACAVALNTINPGILVWI